MRQDERKLLGKRIKQIRESQGYTQAELARQFGLTETDVSKIEEGNFTSELVHILSSLFQTLETSILKRWTQHRQDMWSHNNQEQASSNWPEKPVMADQV